MIFDGARNEWPEELRQREAEIAGPVALDRLAVSGTIVEPPRIRRKSVRTLVCGIVAIGAFALLAYAARGAEPTMTFTDLFAGKSDDYRYGFCAGWNEATKASQRNRDHFMQMDVNFPFETNDEAIKRIQSKPWEELHRDGNIVHQVISIERDAVDLYVVLPKTGINCGGEPQ